MANQLYPKGKEAFITKKVDMSADNIKLILTRDAYVGTEEFLSEIADIVATSTNLTTKAITNGIFDSDDVVFASVAAGAIINYAILYHDSGTAATSYLLAHIDTATGLGVTPDGTNITVEVNASGWFGI